MDSIVALIVEIMVNMQSCLSMDFGQVFFLKNSLSFTYIYILVLQISRL